MKTCDLDVVMRIKIECQWRLQAQGLDMQMVINQPIHDPH